MGFTSAREPSKSVPLVDFRTKTASTFWSGMLFRDVSRDFMVSFAIRGVTFSFPCRSDFILGDNRAIAMGNYYFTDLNGDEAKVEYTFGYKLIGDDLRIDLHHSSFPYNPN